MTVNLGEVLGNRHRTQPGHGLLPHPIVGQQCAVEEFLHSL